MIKVGSADTLREGSSNNNNNYNTNEHNFSENVKSQIKLLLIWPINSIRRAESIEDANLRIE